MNNLIKKTTVLSIFFSLIGGYVYIKSGFFNSLIYNKLNTIQSSHNGGLNEFQLKLELLNYIDNERRSMSTSSKSGYIIEPRWVDGIRKSKGNKKSTKKIIQFFYQKYFQNNDTMAQKYILSGLELELIAQSEHELKRSYSFKIDSLKKQFGFIVDTNKLKFLGSSKSSRIFDFRPISQKDSLNKKDSVKLNKVGR